MGHLRVVRGFDPGSAMEAVFASPSIVVAGSATGSSLSGFVGSRKGTSR